MERIRTAMSPGSMGRPSTVMPESSRRRMRAATADASASRASSSSSLACVSRSRSSKGFSGSSSGAPLPRRASFSPYSISPSSTDMMRLNTSLTASSTPCLERKFCDSRMRRGSPGAGSSFQTLYLVRNIVGSARRKRYIDCLTSPTNTRFFPSREIALNIMS